MPCNGTTRIGTFEDELDTIRYVFCDACRSVRIDSTGGGRKAWDVAYIGEALFRT